MHNLLDAKINNLSFSVIGVLFEINFRLYFFMLNKLSSQFKYMFLIEHDCRLPDWRVD